MKRTNKHKFLHRRGFSLMEVMIAVSILGFISVIIWSSFGRTLQTRDYVLSIQDRYQEIRSAMDRISRELSVAFLSQHQDQLEKRTKTLFKAKRSSGFYDVTFTALAGLKLYENQNASDQCVLKYFAEADPATGQMNLVRRVKDIIDDYPEEEKNFVDFVMLHDIKGFEMQFYDESQDQWVDEWDTENVERGFRLPPTIKFTVTVTDEFGKEQKITTQTRVWMYRPLNFNAR